MRPPLGIDGVNGALRIDVGLTTIERRGEEKRGRGGDMERGAVI